METILLINPSHRDDILENVQILSLPPMNLALLAALTPPRYEVRIVDEAVEEIDFDASADLVGITCMTCLAPRAYEIARRFRERGVPVVLGGIHPSMCSEEAMAFSDAVVVGEAEPVWQRLLDDASSGRLEQRYAGQPADMEQLPVPRRDLLDDGYFVHTVQTSRGCPFDCEFCSVTRFNGGRYRFRSVDSVIAEIADLPGRRFFFADDNIIGSGRACARRAHTLFERLVDLDREWGSQICINIAEDEQLLRAAARSGAKWLFIGLESIDATTLTAMNKRINLRAATSGLGETIKRIQAHGIAVIGGFIFGNDADTPQIFERTVEFVTEQGIDAAMFTIQTPFPGTRLHEQMAAAGRLLTSRYPADWGRYNGFEVVIQPQRMTAEQLAAGQRWAYEQTANLGTAAARAVSTYRRTRSLFSMLSAFCWNHDCHRAIQRRDATKPRVLQDIGDQVMNWSSQRVAQWVLGPRSLLS